MDNKINNASSYIILKNAKKAYGKRNLDTSEVSFLDPPTSSAQSFIGENARKKSNNCKFEHSEYPTKMYKYNNKIGDGSASKLYKGIAENNINKNDNNVQYGDKVIIKKIKKTEEWRSELNILKEIRNKSPRLLKLIDFYESNRFAYIVTDYYDGLDLFEHVDINVPYNLDFGKKLIKEMALCIKDCHDIGVAHLDIKCENYMVVRMDRIKPEIILIDFGHAEKIEPNIMKEGGYYGTCFYICPEGYKKFYSMKSDIWSLGICTHLILTGDYPFWGDDKEYSINVCKGNVTISEKLNGETTDFINKCLDYNPSTRLSIDEVLDHPFLNQQI